MDGVSCSFLCVSFPYTDRFDSLLVLISGTSDGCCTGVCSPSFRALRRCFVVGVVRRRPSVRPSHPADTLIRSVRVQVQGCGRSLVVHRSIDLDTPARRHNFLVACVWAPPKIQSNPIQSTSEIAWVCRAVPCRLLVLVWCCCVVWCLPEESISNTYHM